MTNRGVRPVQVPPFLFVLNRLLLLESFDMRPRFLPLLLGTARRLQRLLLDGYTGMSG
jgi:hypothetical protein